MKLFGFNLLTDYEILNIKLESREKVRQEIIGMLKMKDKIYLEPVTITIPEANIHNCVFFGTMTIKSNKVSL